MTFDKEEYWKLRKEGKRGQGKSKSVDEASKMATSGKISFTNDGDMVMNNRAFRRRKVTLFKKSSQLRKKNGKK